jgi:hypothetical protein
LFEDILSGPKPRDARTGGRFRPNAIEARLDGRERAPDAAGGSLAMTRQQLRKTPLVLGLLLFQIKPPFPNPAKPEPNRSLRGVPCI